MDAKLFIKYENKWVALTPDRQKIVTSAKNIKQLDQKVKKMKISDVIYHFVLPFRGSFSP